MFPEAAGTVVRKAFIAILVLKFLLGAAQLLAGGLLAITPPGSFAGMIHALTRAELAADPTDPLARALNALIPAATTERGFYIAYLLLHGALNAGVAIALALGHRLAYSVSIAVLSAFVLYQLWKFSTDPSPLLLVLTAIDLVVIALSIVEMRGARASKEDRT